MSQTIRPEDILPNGEDTTVMNGRTVRKATVAAFLKNIEMYEDLNATDEQKQQALHIMKELAPDVNAIGLRKHVTFKNPKIEQILVDNE